MENRTVLISGAGIAGPTLAYWLARHGYRPTVVERAEVLRSSGSPVDVRDEAVDVAERMGILPRLREVATDVTELVFLDADGRRAGRIDMRAFQGVGERRAAEVPRGDLARILYDASRDDAEYCFGDAIVDMRDDGDGVHVVFERSAPRRFDLVVGADGLHSSVRRIVFGPEECFVEHMGVYVATMPIDTSTLRSRHEVLMYNTPGRAISVHPSRGDRALAAFFFRSPPAGGLDSRAADAPRRYKNLLTSAFAGGGWRVPELLDRVAATDELYFDSVSRVRLDAWSKGRIAVVGDAASCVSLFGDGSTSAMAGAFTLANELAAYPRDHGTAFRRYEAIHRRRVDPKLENVARAASLLVPASHSGIVLRNLATHLWPMLTLAGRMQRRVSAVCSQVAASPRR